MQALIMINRKASSTQHEVDLDGRDHVILRSNMETKIRYYLQEMIKSDNDPLIQSSLVKLSKIFEAKLYKCAPSLDAYSDPNTLQDRIRILAMQLGKKVEDNQKFSLEERQNSLQIRLGKHVYEEINHLVDKIKCIRLYSFNQLRSREESESGLPSCSGGSCLFLPKLCTTKSGSEIPLPMREIYLNIRLMDAVSMVYSAKTKESMLAHISSVPWSDLIKEANEKISNFELWERTQVVKKEEDEQGI